MKNTLSFPKASSGFVVVMLLMLAPVLAALLAFVFRIVMLVEFRNEFRFKCITESLALQKQLEHSRTNGNLAATELLTRLQKIISPIKYYVTLTDYPDYESETEQDEPKTLAYQLKYSMIPGDPAGHQLTCGIRLRKAEYKWQYESIYSTNEGRF